MKPLVILLTTSVLANAAHAAEYGLGVTFSRSSEIFIPINVRSDLRIEPSFALTRNDFKSGTSEFTTTNRTYILKTGVFSIRPVGEAFNVLAGGRLGYEKFVQRRTDVGFLEDTTRRGFIVEPALAVEYLPFKQLAFGAEISLFYSRLKDKSSQGFSLTDTGTATQLTVKYFY